MSRSSLKVLFYFCHISRIIRKTSWILRWFLIPHAVVVRTRFDKVSWKLGENTFDCVASSEYWHAQRDCGGKKPSVWGRIFGFRLTFRTSLRLKLVLSPGYQDRPGPHKYCKRVWVCVIDTDCSGDFVFLLLLIYEKLVLNTKTWRHSANLLILHLSQLLNQD